MHIHGAASMEYAGLLPTQAMQQAREARKAAAGVRRKLSAFAAGGGEDAVSGVAEYEPGGRGRRQGQPREEDENFRSIFVSFSA